MAPVRLLLVAVARSSAKFLHRRACQLLVALSVDGGRVGVGVTQQSSGDLDPYPSPYSGRRVMPKSVRAESLNLGQFANPMDREMIAREVLAISRGWIPSGLFLLLRRTARA